MKKVLLVISFLLAFSFLFASVDPTPDSDTLQIQGYYEAPAKPIVLSIWDYNDTLLYSTTTSINSNHLGVSSDEIFHWALSGSITAGTDISFAFTTFQACVEDTYYRPAYVIEYELEQNGLFGFQSGSNLSNNKVNVSKASKGTAYDTTYSFVFRSSGAGNSGSGRFLMKISDYYGTSGNENIDATFNYRCDVMVTFTSGE